MRKVCPLVLCPVPCLVVSSSYYGLLSSFSFALSLSEPEHGYDLSLSSRFSVSSLFLYLWTLSALCCEIVPARRGQLERSGGRQGRSPEGGFKGGNQNG